MATSSSPVGSTTPYKQDDIERRVRRVEGVSRVENGIGVLPVLQFDDELRFRIARAIYGNSSFWDTRRWSAYRFTSSSIAGHVTLEGVVQSNVERMLARSLATGFGGVRGDERLVRTPRVREGLDRAGHVTGELVTFSGWHADRRVQADH